MWHTYILICADGTFYTGITTDLIRRIDEHNGIDKGKNNGAKYTRVRRPVRLAYSEEYANREQASKREWELKQYSHAEKKDLYSGTSV